MKIIEKIVKWIWDKPLEFIISRFKFLASTHEDISNQEYLKLFEGYKLKRALDKAWEIRNFEIEMYWKRATYFWAFIAVAFGGYFAFINPDNAKQNNPELEYVIICIGIIFSIAWLLVNISSKKWQQNWEGHIDKLEDQVTGPIYKIVRNEKLNYSVSKINIFVSAFILIIWLILALNYFCNIITFSCHHTKIALVTILTTLITILFILVIIVNARTGYNSMAKGYYERNS